SSRLLVAYEHGPAGATAVTTARPQSETFVHAATVSGRGLAFSWRPSRASGEQIMNNVKTFVLLAGLMGLFLIAGQLLGGSQGLVMALIFGSLFNFVMYFFSD